MPASNFYEVRCENCRTSFPPEAKRCIHCGGPLGSHGARWQPGPGMPPPEGEEDMAGLPGSRARNILWLVTAGLAIAMSAARSCMER